MKIIGKLFKVGFFAVVGIGIINLIITTVILVAIGLIAL